MNLYSVRVTWHKGFGRTFSRFFGHPQDTRSYPPRPALFPPRCPQDYPQTVEQAGDPRRSSAIVVVAAAAQVAEQALAGPGRGLGHPADGADERVRRAVP